MRLWRFENKNREVVRENMRNEKVLNQLEVNLKIFKDNHKELARIMEKVHGYELGEIEEWSAKRLSEQLKTDREIKAYVKQFSKFGNLGFTPYVVLEV
ncbi:hypothetical protein GNF53_11635 [Clostridium perfringens]|uniref:hypothetical protein n=1 Tax=Clostridium perfringens TaxID=1502 RepID=UPI001A2248CE|nr:hypothetical protein [Clostridium perfringens]MDK0658207.1 hypothetical protein [Clostridium perfringens]MDM0661878.1 hypothetical protein [Clostridium perfringens]MDZ5148635.1 hypothetical protein [Clostridium perfringens]HAT4225843.1 hypothetical protein [Clostridium perfringens]HBI6221959.1 hypothetical protein [Clostridium perfringens]